MRISEIYESAGIRSLPFDPAAAAEAAGVKTVSYGSLARVYDVDMNALYRKSKWGFSFLSEGRPVIAINENACCGAKRRFTVAHELGHCLLGHLAFCGSSEPLPEFYERRADGFAAELLAPLCVLGACRVSSAREISRLCGLSAAAAEIRFAELRVNTAPADERILAIFSGYIERILSEKIKHNSTDSVISREKVLRAGIEKL